MTTTTSDQKARTIKATVARGRSIEVPIEGRRLHIGNREDGSPVTMLATRSFREGQDVELPAEEVATLRQAGYLVDPDNLPPPVDTPELQARR